MYKEAKNSHNIKGVIEGFSSKAMSKYGALGVDVRKKGIERFKSVIDNLYPGAFCVITADPSNPEMGLVNHADSAGSKPIVSYLAYRETDDPQWFKGVAYDVMAMNIDDLVCVAADPISFVDYIAYNPMIIDRVQLLEQLSQGFGDCFSMLRREGLNVLFGGGETADLPDQMRTLDVSGALFGKVPLSKVITGQAVQPGDLVIGLNSGGKVRYEEGVNSGLMCNGITLARNSLLKREYLDRYPELAHPDRRRFTGSYRLDDAPDGLGMTVVEALTSPTRIFAPVVTAVLSQVGGGIHGMVHNTGGGQTKCLRVGAGVRYVKDSLPDPDPIFQLIQAEGDVAWREMYEDFNMGVGYEFIVNPDAAETVLGIAESFGIGVQIIGHCEESTENSLVIDSNYGRFSYQ